MGVESTLWGVNQVGAIFIAAGLAAVVAIWAIFSQRAIAARTATIEFIRYGESDRDVIKAFAVFNRLAKEPGGLVQWASQTTSKEFTAIKIVLNHYELAAIAIQRGTFDDATFKRWIRSGVVRAWNDAAAFIHSRRNSSGNQTLWYEFEELARWYRGGKQMPRRRFFWSKFF